MAAGHGAWKRTDDVVAVEIAGNMAHRTVGVELVPVPRTDSGGLLSAVLQSVKAKCHERGR
jgi:hypothetical protein